LYATPLTKHQITKTEIHTTINTMEKSITNISIFGEYQQSENRVTAALLHVINLGGQSIVQRLFGDLFDIPSNTINIIPQNKQKKSVPDGVISCDCKYSIFIESKIVCNAIDEVQLKNHCALINPAENKYLCYITPDETKPKPLCLLSVEWLSWKDIIESLLGMIADGLVDAVLSYFIKELIKLIEHLVYHNRTRGSNQIASSTIANNKRVIIVGGRWGENVAIKYGFYACQDERFFLPAKYIAFYHSHRIKYVFEIESINDHIDIATIPKIQNSDYFQMIEPNYTPQKRRYMNLKHVCTTEISNDKVDKNGKPCAFVQGQSYTTIDKIKIATKTSQL
jgi:hypothetical protein